jgi:(p)ppGpp synthase/HD superfamily hydrolase
MFGQAVLRSSVAQQTHPEGDCMANDPGRIAAEILRAAEFAAHAHRDQRDKGKAGGPYVNHLIEVAHLLAAAGAPLPVIIAGLLHDTIEDVDVTAETLAIEFGAEVSALVQEVTDNKSLPKAERKALQVAKAPHKSDGAKMIKLADKTSNMRRLLRTPPDWDSARKQEYFAWSLRVAAGCRGVSSALEAAFDAAHAEGVAALADA